jgi:DNA-directed RNA polymerase II subunit RPB1
MDSKRRLTREEIDEILHDLPFPNIPFPEVRNFIINTIKEALRSQLYKVLIYPSKVSKIKAVLHTSYANALAPPGDPVGILASQTMESYTQGTMNMFHTAGITVKSVTTGLPRFEEITNATTKPKVIGFNFFFKQECLSSNEARERVLLTEVKLLNITKQYQIGRGETKTEEWYPYFERLYSSEYKKGDHMIRFHLDLNALYRHNLDLFQISRKIEEVYKGIYCVFSPLKKGIIDVYIDTSDIRDDEKRLYVHDTVLNALQNAHLFGTKGIEMTFPVEKDGKWYLEGNGGKLIDLLSHPSCDARNTVSDFAWDVLDCLGIEAARTVLIEELNRVMTMDGWVNPKHPTLLIDIMTVDGTIYAINRHGMKRENVGALARAAYEETVDNLLRSGILGESDRLGGISASIITGRPPPVGGELCDVMIDTEKLETIIEEETRLHDSTPSYKTLVEL